MHRLSFLNSIIFLLSFNFFQATASDSIPAGIFRKWRLETIPSPDTVKTISPPDSFLFYHDSIIHKNRFQLFIGNEIVTGSCRLTGKSLIFLFDSDFSDKSDSLSGDSAIPEAGIMPGEFTVVSLSDSNLVLSHDSAQFSYACFVEKPVTPNQPRVRLVQKTVTGFSLNSLWRGLIGIATLLLILFAFSRNRRAISWKLVISGLLLQTIFAFCVLYVPIVKTVFEVAGKFFVIILSFTRAGAEFLFGNLMNGDGSIGFIFAFQILPTILFFSALTSVLFYLGVLQKIVYGIAWVMSRAMKMSGAESLSAAANIFIGQTEAPLLIKPYIGNMTRSEILCIMIGGMATIAGGVMAAYIGFLGGNDPVLQLFYAKHLLCASVMSAPAAVVAAKILLPQTQAVEAKINISQEKIGSNFLEAIANGTYDGLRLAVNVGAMLLVFIALVAMVNYFLKDVIGHYADLNRQIAEITNGRYDGLTLQFLLGLGCAPLSWLLGVCTEDMVLVGQLLGEKTILNEFVAYATLGNMQFSGSFVEEKSIIIATYILCGFSNFSSIGIQIGGIGALAPNQKTTLSELGIPALIGGTAASLFTAVIVGIIL